MTEGCEGTLLQFGPRLDVWTSAGDEESKRVTSELLRELGLKLWNEKDEDPKIAAMKQAANVLGQLLSGNGTIFPAKEIDKALYDLNEAIRRE